MRKSLIGAETGAGAGEQAGWIDLETVARVEVSTEDEHLPIEGALGLKPTMGWRAGGTGPQVIRLLFDEAMVIRRIQVHVVEQAQERMQEMTILAGPEAGALREIARQQFTFSPGGATEEREDYRVELAGIRVLELRIDPDRSHDPAASRSYATLRSLKLG